MADALPGSRRLRQRHRPRSLDHHRPLRGPERRRSLRLVLGGRASGCRPGGGGMTPVDPTPFDLPLTDPRHPFHLEHMAMALDEAAAAAAEDEVPVGAVIVSPKLAVIGRAHN